MRANTMRVTGAACLVAAAAVGGCRDGKAAGPTDDGLARDLARAAEVVETRAAGRTRFVSPLEAGLEVPGAESAPSPRGTSRGVRTVRARQATARLASRRPASRGAAAAPAPETSPAEAEVSDAVTEAPAAVAAPEPEAPATSSEPVAHGPQADEAPAAPAAPVEEQRERRRGGWGRILGGIGGAVIRGGSIGDDDHCERDNRRRGRGGLGGLDPMGGGDRTMPTRGTGRVGGPIFPRY